MQFWLINYCLADLIPYSYIVAKFGPPRGTAFGKGDHFWQLVQGTTFGNFFAKIGPGDQFWGWCDRPNH